jgi:4-amino-4-deoxy-L-arabinose transferase-like glycosyltransferase
VWNAGNDGFSMIRSGRLVTVALTVLLGGLVYHWSLLVHGQGGALVSLASLVFTPMILAHGALITTDIGLALSMLLYWFCVWRFLHRPTTFAGALAGFALGIALASKHLAWLNVPVTLLILLVIHRKGAFLTRPVSLTSSLVAVSVLTVLWLFEALLVVWACYGFQLGVFPGTELTIPAPDYWSGLLGGWSNLQLFPARLRLQDALAYPSPDVFCVRGDSNGTK